MRGNSIRQAARTIDARQRGQYFRRDFLVQLYVLIELRKQAAAHRLDFVIVAFILRNGRNLGFVVFLFIYHAMNARAMHAFDQHFYRAVGQFQHLQNTRDRADRIKIFRRRVVIRGRFLRDQDDILALFHRGFQRLDRFGASDKKRDHHMRKHHHVAQGQQGKDGGIFQWN